MQSIHFFLLTAHLIFSNVFQTNFLVVWSRPFIRRGLSIFMFHLTQIASTAVDNTINAVPPMRSFCASSKATHHGVAIGILCVSFGLRLHYLLFGNNSCLALAQSSRHPVEKKSAKRTFTPAYCDISSRAIRPSQQQRVFHVFSTSCYRIPVPWIS